MPDQFQRSSCRIYGIRNCETMKKAFAWLDEHGVAYDYVDYRKSPVGAAQLTAWSHRTGWKILLNTRGTTWKRLPEADRTEVDEASALRLMIAHPTLIKRPVVDTGDALLVGFDSSRYAAEFLIRKA